MPKRLTLDVLLLGAGAFALVTRLPLDGTDGVVIDFPAFADAENVTRFVGVHASAVADAPFADEPFHAFARLILDFATFQS